LLEERKQEPDVFRRLQSLSFEAFQFAGKNFGTALAGKIFERTYEVFSRPRYKELEFFPHLLHSHSQGYRWQGAPGIFSQAQIEQSFWRSWPSRSSSISNSTENKGRTKRLQRAA